MERFILNENNIMFEKLHRLFAILEKEFPYSTMGEDFKGHHHIYRERTGTIVLMIWCNNKAWRISTDNEIDLFEIKKIIKELKQTIKNWDVKTKRSEKNKKVLDI